MATQSGTNATVKIGDVTVADMASWSLDRTREALKAPIFGQADNKVHGMGSRNQSGSVEGFLNVDDSTGQEVLRLAWENGTKLTTFRLYINDTDYYGSDIIGDTEAGVYITTSSTSAAQDQIIPVTFNFEVSGQFELTNG